MATRTSNIPRNFEWADEEYLPVVATDILFEGSALGWSSSTVRPLVSGDGFAGFAMEYCDNSLGAASAKTIKVRRRGFVYLPVTGVVAGDDGHGVYATDDDTFTAVNTAGTKIGIVHRVTASGYAMVELQPVDLELKSLSGSRVASAAFTIGTESGDAIIVGIQLNDAKGDPITEATNVRGYLASDSAGLNHEADSATLTITGGTDGSVMPYGATDAIGSTIFDATSEADGDIDLTITESVGANTVYVVLVMPNGDLQVSSAVTFA